MFEKVKDIISKSVSLAYEKVYVITFKGTDKPIIYKEKLSELGKWYVSGGEEWICHSDIPLEEFKEKFLFLINVLPEQVSFREDHLPFSK